MLNRAVVSLMLIGLAGCASGGNSSSTTAAPSSVAGSAGSAVTYPKDAQFTIFCVRYTGAAHVERAARSRDELIRTTHMRDWYTVIENDQTLLYYGFYKSIEDPKAQQDRKKIELMMDAQTGDRPFRQALFVELTSPDPAAPPEWNLMNAQGRYTLQIGVYKGSPQRKDAAVSSVAEARKQGIPAFYYHGETSSLVCVGVWPASAIKFSDQGSAGKTNDPEQLLIYPPNVNDPALNRAFDEAAKQTNGRIIRQNTQIVDPTLEQTMRQFPYNTINGNYMKKVVNGKEQFDPSQIIQLPERKSTPQAQPGVAGAQKPTGPAYDPNYRPKLPSQAPPPSQQPAQPGSGQLRGIGN